MGGCLSVLPWGQAVTQACNSLFGDGNYIHLMKANLEALEASMQTLRDRRDDLLTRVSIEEDKGLQRLAEVKRWLARVESIDSQVSDLLTTKPAEINRLCLFGYFSENCISSYEYGKEVSKKLEKVKELLSREAFGDVAIKGRLPKVEQQPIQTTVGLDSMVGKAWDSIMKPEGRTLGIYGMGGVGKTTLLARINNKFDVEKNEFDVVIWVVVSKDLQYKGIQDQILRRLRADQELEKETEEKKASFIDNILRRKKFILLLDDLWSEVDLNKIGVPRPTQENGSKIVFTTRSKKVCSDMEADDKLQIDCLPANEAWELFRSIVGEDLLNLHPDIPKIAKTISEKCYGLPLALNVIGKTMKYKEDVHEWRDAIDVLSTSSHEFPDMEEKILSILKFSYDGLETEKMKSCFMYCSLFPEDYEIKKEDLIECWISEGFINGKRDEDGSNNKGHGIIGSLVRAHLLMESKTTVKMHDVLREMALWIGKEEEKQCVKSGGKLRRIPDDINWSVSRRISLMRNQIEEISCCPKCPNLSTLFLGDNNLEVVPGKFFQFMPALVVLDLSHNRYLSELPEEICRLTSLQYLNLSYTRISSLSVGLKGLRKLISLDLEYCLLLTSIDGIGTSLPNLQVLKLYFSSVYIRSIEELQLLEHLKILTGNVKDALMLESIQRVERLASCVQRLLISEISAEVLTLNTAALGGLQKLVIGMFKPVEGLVRCVQRLRIINMSAEVLTLNRVALGGLRELEIINSKISEIKIDWKCKGKEDLPSPCFKHLFSIVIQDLEGPKELSWLLFAPNLKHLHVANSKSLEEIINKEKGMSISNVHLKVEYLPSIEEIINKEKGMSISNVHPPDMTVPFAKLQSLTLWDLVELKRICSDPQPLPSLKNVLVEKCPKLPEAAIREFQRHEQE